MFTSVFGVLFVLIVLGVVFGPIVWGIFRKKCFPFTHDYQYRRVGSNWSGTYRDVCSKCGHERWEI